MMRHLTSEQLVDLAEGTLPERSMPHLQSCAACRATLAELRRTLSAAGEAAVPEPSPLFWDHFSARVHAAVERERADRPSIFGRGQLWRMVPWWTGSLAVLVIVVALMTRGRVSEAPAPSGSTVTVAERQADVPAAADDPSLLLVADLVTGLDWDAAVEAGFTTHLGVDDDVVTQLTDGERRELQQLLREETTDEVESTK